MRSYLSLILLILSSFSLSVAQDDPIDRPLNELLDNLKEYQEKFPREKVYVQLDRDRYEAGDDMWFKAYTTISQFNFLSAVSRIIYVELIDSRNEIVLSSRLPVVSGLSFGDFALPDSLPDGCSWCWIRVSSLRVGRPFGAAELAVFIGGSGLLCTRPEAGSRLATVFSKCSS